MGNGLGPFGTYDLAGNVREWTRTSDGPLRYAMGASSSEHSYQFVDWQLFEPLNRGAGFGMRLIQQDEPVSADLLADVSFTVDSPPSRSTTRLSRSIPVSTNTTMRR